MLRKMIFDDLYIICIAKPNDCDVLQSADFENTFCDQPPSGFLSSSEAISDVDGA